MIYASIYRLKGKGCEYYDERVRIALDQEYR